MSHSGVPVYLAAGVRTPFPKASGAFAHLDASELSLPVMQEMAARLGSARPDMPVWGSVIPNLAWSNIAREVLLDAGRVAHRHV
jgi:acetyl-CoA C-acetyltransferase